MKKRWIYFIAALTMGIFILTGCSESVIEYKTGDRIDVSTDNEHRITLTVKGAKELDEMQRISAGLASAEGKAIAVDFSASAIGKEESFIYTFRFRVKNQDGKWMDPSGYLENGNSLSMIQKYSAVYLVGDEDSFVTFYAFDDKKAVGRVVLPLAFAVRGEELEGFGIEAQLEALSFRFPDDYIVDDTGVPLTVTSPENELVIEAWHYTGAKGKKDKDLAEETFRIFVEETEGINESTGAYSSNWNGHYWYNQYDYSASMKYIYMLAVEGDDYYVVRFTITLSGYGEVADDIDTIRNLMLLAP